MVVKGTTPEQWLFGVSWVAAWRGGRRLLPFELKALKVQLPLLLRFRLHANGLLELLLPPLLVARLFPLLHPFFALGGFQRPLFLGGDVGPVKLLGLLQLDHQLLLSLVPLLLVLMDPGARRLRRDKPGPQRQKQHRGQ